jgi:hypothetical protein
MRVFERFKKEILETPIIHVPVALKDLELSSEHEIKVSGTTLTLGIGVFKEICATFGFSMALDPMKTAIGNDNAVSMVEIVRVARSYMDKSKKHDIRMTLLVDKRGMVVQGVQRSGFGLNNGIPRIEFFNAVESAINKNNLQITDLSYNKRTDAFKIITRSEDWAFEVPNMRDEEFKSGLSFYWGEFAETAAYFERLVCGNGVTLNSPIVSFDTRIRPNRDLTISPAKFIEMVRSVGKPSENFFNEKVSTLAKTPASYRELHEVSSLCGSRSTLSKEEIEERFGKKSFGKEFAMANGGIHPKNLSQIHQAQIRTHKSRWEIINDYTYIASNHEGLDTVTRNLMFGDAGQMICNKSDLGVQINQIA